MANIQPFRGLRYNTEKVGDISLVISPPYDVISPEEQRLYYQQSPYNVVRVEFGEEYPSDSPESNKYIRAANTLERWLDEGILFREPHPAFYIFEHCFTHHGATKQRWGLTARMRLEEQGSGRAYAHETTLEERIGDRIKLMRSCRVNPSPILGMVRRGLLPFLSQFTRGDPDLSATDRYGVTHNMWVVTDRQSIAAVSAWGADKVIYIADGHHRYKAALAYQREQQTARASCSRNEAFDFVMITLIDAEDPGVVILPTHRLVRLPEPRTSSWLREKLRLFFDLEELNPAGATLPGVIKVWRETLGEGSEKGISTGLYGLDKRGLCLLTPREKLTLQALLPSNHSQDWKELNVAFLHHVILPRIIGIDTPQKEENCLAYTHDEQEAINRVDSGEYQLAFLMNPVSISSVLAIADAGDRMPPKSTYFYPKLPTGLVMYPLWDDL